MCFKTIDSVTAKGQQQEHEEKEEEVSEGGFLV